MKINVKHVAKLASLNIPENEEKKFENQLNEILSFIEKLNSANTENIETTSQITGLENITRKDQASSSLSQDKALSNTKSKHNGMFKVKKIL